MARLERLRWVPMLIRAYYNAQERLGNGLPPPEMGRAVEARADDGPGPDKRKMGKRVQSDGKSARPPGHARVRARPPARADKNARLLREIREANRRLQGLQAIEHKLQQLGSVLDEFQQHINRMTTQPTTTGIAEPTVLPAGNDTAQPWQPEAEPPPART